MLRSLIVKEPKDIVEVLKPLYTLSRCLGAAPYTLTKKKDSYTVSTTWIDYSLFLVVNSYMSYLFYMCYGNDHLQHSGSEIMNLGTHFMLMTSLIVFIFLNFVNLFLKHKTGEILKELIVIDQNMALLSIDIDHKSHYKDMIKYLFCCFSLITTLTIFTGYIFNLVSGCFWFELIVFVTFITSNLSYANFVSTFIFALRSVQDRYKQLNEGISDVFDPKKLNAEEDLSHIVSHMESIHDRLNEVVQKINVRYSFWIMMLFGIVFVIGVLCVFSFMRAVIIYDRLTFLACLMRFVWTLYYILYLMMIIAAGSYTTREGKNSSVMVHRATTVTRNNNTREEVFC